MPEIAADANAVIGSWRLVSIATRLEDTGELIVNPNALGFIIFEANGRMMAILHGAGRSSPMDDAEAATQYRRLTAYTGRYHMEGNRCVTKVDGAWQPGWEGSEQVRYVALDGDTLTLSTDPMEHTMWPGRKISYVVTWQRER